MPSDLSGLIKIQELDQQIDRLSNEIANLPRHVAAIEARLAQHQKALADKRGDLDENGREHRRLEGEVQACSEKLSKLQDQMNGAKTNEQFRAFQHEIQFCRETIDGFEERILEKMEQAETLQGRVAKAAAELEVEQAKVAREVRLAGERIEEDKRVRDEKRAARNALSAQVEPATLQVYERVRKSRGTAVAAVHDETCDSCHVRVRPKFLQDLRHIETGVLTCESCGLILHLPEPPDPGIPVSEPAAEMATTPRP